MKDQPPLTPDEIRLANPVMAKYMGIPAGTPVDRLRFHRSWSWLHMVIEKIGGPHINPRTGLIFEMPPEAYPDSSMMHDIDKLNLFSSFPEAYRAVYKYIIWFNEQVKKL